MANSDNFWLRFSSKELEEKIKAKPLTLELLSKTLFEHVDRIVLRELGEYELNRYMVIPPSEKEKAVIYAPKNPSSTDRFEFGIIHELSHLVYRTQGNHPIQNPDTELIEKMLDDISLEFQKNNRHKVLWMFGRYIHY